jgi:hypothetical protein
MIEYLIFGYKIKLKLMKNVYIDGEYILDIITKLFQYVYG